jgi:chromosome segregation ATPase
MSEDPNYKTKYSYFDNVKAYQKEIDSLRMEMDKLQAEFKSLQDLYRANVCAYYSQAQDLKVANQTLETYRDLHNAKVEAYEDKSNQLRVALENIKQKESIISVLKDRLNAAARMREQFQELSQYKHINKNTQEQIETLRFDNEHLQKDIAEKDLQIAALKDEFNRLPILESPINWEKDLEQYNKIQNLEKEKDYWRAVARTLQREMTHIRNF